ncbi:MAG: hypothetical protein WAW69_09455, partial [Polaromonas sp.]
GAESSAWLNDQPAPASEPQAEPLPQAEDSFTPEPVWPSIPAAQPEFIPQPDPIGIGSPRTFPGEGAEAVGR